MKTAELAWYTDRSRMLRLAEGPTEADRKCRFAAHEPSMSGRWSLAVFGYSVPWDGMRLEAEQPVNFDREIRPILSEHCFACHGPDKQARKADLRLDKREDVLRVREGIAVIVPAKVEDSELVRRVASTDPDEVMPPPAFKKRLNSQQIDRLRQWVVEGAKWEGHWSLTLPGRAAGAAGE